MEFEVGDEVVYTPHIENLLSAKQRKGDHGIVREVIGDYVKFQFNYYRPIYYLLKVGVSHAPYSRKGIKMIFRPCLDKIKELVSAREARRVMLFRTPFTVRLPGPAHLVQDFLTGVKRSKVNLKNLAEA